MKTGIHFKQCNIKSAEKHNAREKDYLDAVEKSGKKKYDIFHDRIETNTSWINPEYAGKTLEQILDNCRRCYVEHVGQRPQEGNRTRILIDRKTGMKKEVITEGWAPIREGVCPVKEDTTIEDFMPFVQYLKNKGLTVVRIDIHRDEGYENPITKERKYNYHAHIIVDWTDHETGRTAKLNKDDTRDLQTEIAASLGMERGLSKEETGAENRTVTQQREYAATKHAKELEEKNKSLMQIIENNKDVLNRQKEGIEKNKGIIDKQLTDLNARKEELVKTKTDIAANKETITQQKQTISTNEATIQKQEKLKSSTVISDDAAEKKILEKLQTVKQLEAEEYRLSRSIVNKKTELATADANLKKRLRMIEAKANLDDVPKKGAFGYNSDKVTAFIESVEMASLKRAMSWTPSDNKVETAIREENDRLRKVEDDYKKFMNSPERMQKHIEYLENKTKLHKIAAVLEYVVQETVIVTSFTIDNATEEIFAKFTKGRSATEYTAIITPEESVYYTDKPIKNLQEAKARGREKIWRGDRLNDIRKKREKEDTMKRYSTKLSRLIGKDIKVTDYLSDGKDSLFSASNGLKYLVQASGNTFSTKDARVISINDVYKVKGVWKAHGNITTSQRIKRGVQ